MFIVEDNPDIRDLLITFFSTRGFAVVAAINGADAMRMATASGVRPTVILLDLAMPVMDGFEFLERQHEVPALDGVPVVVLSADAREASVQSPTVRAVLDKPVALPILFSLVQNICEGSPNPRAPALFARGSDRTTTWEVVAPSAEDLVLEQRGPLIGDMDIEAFEIAIGTRLQIDYREFLLDWNGGVPVPHTFAVDGKPTQLARFYSLGAARPIDDLATRRMALRRLVPADLLAIARDAAGHLVCFGIAGDSVGCVYHLAIDRTSRRLRLPPTKLKRSFSEFLEELTARSPVR